MQNSKVLTGILLISGLMILAAGAFTLFNPVGFTARNGIDLGEQISLFNDIRGMGGLMVGSGLIILLGVFHAGMRFTSAVVAAVIFLTFALARVLSIIVDGVPAENLVRATIVELVVGLAAAFGLWKYRAPQEHLEQPSEQ